MSVAAQSVVQPILKSFEVRVSGVMDGAWSDWLALPVAIRGMFSKRTRANCIFDFIKLRAVREFTGDNDIQVLPKGQTVKFLFKDVVLARFKKANAKGIGSNINTQAVLQFVNPQYQLFDTPPLHHIEFCYEEDALATGITSITVNARQLYRRVWSYQIERPGSAAIVPINTSPQNDSSDGAVVVRPRESSEESPNADYRGFSK